MLGSKLGDSLSGIVDQFCSIEVVRVKWCFFLSVKYVDAFAQVLLSRSGGEREVCGNETFYHISGGMGGEFRDIEGFSGRGLEEVLA
jgi:hypothetical protein